MEKTDYTKKSEEELARIYLEYTFESDSNGDVGGEIASAVSMRAKGGSPETWARNVLERIEKLSALERKAAEMLDASIIKKRWNIYDHTGLAKQILGEVGLRKINVNGVEKNLSRLRVGELVGYSKDLLKKYSFPEEPEKY